MTGKKIYVVVSRSMNNFDILHQGIEINGHQVYFHRDAKMSVIDGKAHYNFDYMITNGHLDLNDRPAHFVLPKSMCRVHWRYSKLEQSIMMNQYMEQYPDSGYIPLSTWMNVLTDGGEGLVNPGGKVVIKPKDGARGIGQYLVDTDKVPFAKVMDAIDRFAKERYTEDQLIEALDKYKEGIVYSSSGENYDGEGLFCLRGQGYVIQSYVEGIDSEYRIITGGNSEIAYCQKRKIRKGNDGFAQATGSDTDSVKGDDVVDIKTVLKPDALSGLKRLLKDVVGPLSSVDLFVTSPSNWGIFEFCNQFGMVGVPHQTARQIHVDYLSSIIAK